MKDCFAKEIKYPYHAIDCTVVLLKGGLFNKLI